ncbi:hypothetical protein NL676_021908 [Syzygium grande]|nr:hypothetical protein NL676_021908 [Syzygium grande]
MELAAQQNVKKDKKDVGRSWDDVNKNKDGREWDNRWRCTIAHIHAFVSIHSILRIRSGGDSGKNEQRFRRPLLSPESSKSLSLL